MQNTTATITLTEGTTFTSVNHITLTLVKGTTLCWGCHETVDTLEARDLALGIYAISEGHVCLSCGDTTGALRGR